MDSLYISVTDEKMTMYDLGFNIIIADCDNIFVYQLVDRKWNTMSREELNSNGEKVFYSLRTNYVIKDNKIYQFHENQWLLMDESQFHFNNEVKLFNRYVITRKGELLESSCYQAIESQNHYLLTCYDKLSIYDFSGEFVDSFTGVSVASRSQQYIKIRYLNDKMGLYAPWHKSWKVKPIYYNIFPISRRRRQENHHFWAKLESEGEKQLPFETDFPTVVHEARINIIQSKKKYGVIDAEFNVVLPPEYDHIAYSSGDYVIRKGKLWGSTYVQ
ncbi:MAG: WG repeat-containing protein [Crocinitomicaceae bacterium]|nr:WG repeat-containing protein [Crocinitomicaceae bacterium]